MAKFFRIIATEDFVAVRATVLLCTMFPVVAYNWPHPVKIFLVGCVLLAPVLAMISLLLAFERKRFSEYLFAMAFGFLFLFDLTLGFEMML